MKFVKINAWPWEKTPVHHSEENHKKVPNDATGTGGYKPRTELGRKLLEIRDEATAEGMKLKTLEELEKDNEERKGTII